MDLLLAREMPGIVLDLGSIVATGPILQDGKIDDSILIESDVEKKQQPAVAISRKGFAGGKLD